LILSQSGLVHAASVWWQRLKAFIKPTCEIVLGQPGELKVAKKHPPFFKGGQRGLEKRLIIPLNPSLEKGDMIKSVPKIFMVANMFAA
jgi:hypothetical protein